MNKKYIGTALSLVVAVTGIANADTWDGGGVDDDFATADNWVLNVAPGGTDTSTLDTGDTITRNVDSSTGRFFVEDGSTVNIASGTHGDNNTGSSTRNFIGRGSTATINQSGGTYNIGHMLAIGGGGANGNGTYNLTGGTLSIYRGANSIVDPSNPFGRPSLDVSDEENAGSGLMQISGGLLETRSGAHIGQTGTFSVMGSGATSIGIGSNGSLDGGWLQHAGGTLKMAIDGSGVTSVLIADNGGGLIGTQFDAGSLLDLSFDGVAAYAGTWTLMEVENADITEIGSGLELSGATAAGWSFDVDNTGTNGLLTATYVIPEPATLGLVAAFGGSILFIRRRFMI